MDGGPRGRSDWWKIGGGDTKSRELCGPAVSRESKVNVDLIQGSALSPLLFIAVVELISRKICIKVILQKLLYATALSVVEDGEANLQEQLIEWKDIFQQTWIQSTLG